MDMRQGSITHRNIYVAKVFSVREVSTNMERKYKKVASFYAP